jgi:hypothetical protein
VTGDFSPTLARRKMKNTIRQFLLSVPLLAIATGLLTSCGSLGDVGDVKEANKLAVACKTNEALAAVDRAAGGGGLSAYIADLQRAVILRDAGRISEAEAALAEHNKRAGIRAEDAAEAEQSVEKSVEELRSAREKETGHRTCS